MDAIADVAFTALSAINLVFGPEKDRGINALALGADVGSIFVPCATGLGMVVVPATPDHPFDVVSGG